MVILPAARHSPSFVLWRPGYPTSRPAPIVGRGHRRWALIGFPPLPGWSGEGESSGGWGIVARPYKRRPGGGGSLARNELNVGATGGWAERVGGGGGAAPAT